MPRRVLAFELANRAYFAASISDRGDEFFDQFTDRFNALLAEQEAGTCACYVLVTEDGSVLGRFNLVDIKDHTAELGYRVAQHAAGRGVAWRPRPSGSCAGWRRPSTGCAQCGRPLPAAMPRPRRCWRKPGSSRPAQPTRPTSAVSQAPGISATSSSSRTLKITTALVVLGVAIGPFVAAPEAARGRR